MDYRSILSGQRRDPLAIFFRLGLWCAQWPYRVIVAIRNRRFDRDDSLIQHAEVPVISIGNLTTGGTGKTPLVCYLAKQFRQRGIRVAIISRGYGADAGEENDEALELAARLPDVPHVQDADRVAAARIATEELESQLLLMDDGFQHRRLARDLDIVVLDATNPFGFGHCLPRGLLREPIGSLRRAEVVVLSRANLIDESQRARLHEQVARLAPKSVWCEAEHRPSELLRWPDQSLPLTHLQDQPVAVLSAIGNPQAFERTVAACGAQVIDTMSLADHDPYDHRAIEKILHWLNRIAVPKLQVVCTHKDLVKLQTDQLGPYSVAALLIDISFTTGEQELLRMVDKIATDVASDE